MKVDHGFHGQLKHTARLTSGRELTGAKRSKKSPNQALSKFSV
jgi:hypothetical protein